MLRKVKYLLRKETQKQDHDLTSHIQKNQIHLK
jgi:hypothetical protein